MFNDLYNFIDEKLHNNLSEFTDVTSKKLLYQGLFFGTLSSILGNVFDFNNMEEIKEIDLKRCYLYAHYIGYSKRLENFVPLTPKGSRNFFNEYTDFESAIGDLKDNFSVTDKENIVGFNKSFYTVSDAFTCYVYACRLAELIISIDNAVVASRILNIFVGNENQKKEMEDYWQRINMGIPYTITEEFYDRDTAKVLQLQKPEEINKFYDAFRDIINEFMMVSGLSALLNPTKKERLLTDEVTAGNEDIKGTILYDKYQNRKAFLDKINDVYGTNYEVTFNVNMDDYSYLLNIGGEEDV